MSAATRRLKTRIDVSRNVADIVLQLLIAVFQRNFHLTDAVENGGVVTVEFLADIGKAEVGQLPDQVSGDLASFRGTLVLQSASEHILFNGIEFADLV